MTLLVRGESLAASMSQYLIEQIATKANIPGVETRSEVVANGDEQLEAIEVIDGKGRHDIAAGYDGALRPHRRRGDDRLAPPQIARDEHGFILTGADAMKAGQWKADREPFALETSTPGMLAIGDVRSGSVKRVAAAVGEGGITMAFVHRYLLTSARAVVSAAT